jgi:hypothetical protein
VRREAAQSWSSLNSVLDGSSAIAGAQLNRSLQNAIVTAPQGGGMGGGRGGRGGGANYDFAAKSLGLPAAGAAAPAAPSMPAAAARAREQLIQYSQQSQFVNGRNFFQNGAQWTDSEVQKNQAAKHTRLQFNSPEYFDFLAKNQQALPWLALGQNVQFVLDGVVYEIYE